MEKAVLTKKDFEEMLEKEYVKWFVRIGIREKVLANFPDNLNALKMAVLMTKKKEKLSDEEAEALAEEMMEDYNGEEGTGKCVFLKDENGIYIRPRHIKGLMKEVLLKCMNVRGARDYINHGVHVKPEKIYFTRNGEIIKQADGEETIPISVMTRKGRRNSISIAEAIYAPAELSFYLLIPKTLARGKFTDEVMIKIWLYAQDVGILGKRSLGEAGQFDVLELRRVK